MSRSRTLLVLTLLAASASVATAAPIIGGTAAAKGDFPSVAVLLYFFPDGSEAECTGELIDPEWVMTAAHCVDPAIIGLANQAAVTALVEVHFNTVDVTTDLGEKVLAKETFFDPAYQGGASHDLGLIHLVKKVTDVTPSPVNLLTTTTPVGSVVTQVGFGTRQTGAQGPFGAEFVLKNRTAVACSSQSAIGPLDDAALMCFSQTDGKGECEGDSGGPSFMMLDGKLTIVAVTSIGDQNCAVVGADTRPEFVKSFLLSHVPQAECSDDGQCATAKTCFAHGCMVAPFSPTGLGTTCTGNAECDSSNCEALGSDQLCTRSCTVGDATTCPDGFDCLDAGGGAGACWPTPAAGGGCCDAGTHGVPTMLFGIGLVAIVLGRRSRRGRR